MTGLLRESVRSRPSCGCGPVGSVAGGWEVRLPELDLDAMARAAATTGCGSSRRATTSGPRASTGSSRRRTASSCGAAPTSPPSSTAASRSSARGRRPTTACGWPPTSARAWRPRLHGRQRGRLRGRRRAHRGALAVDGPTVAVLACGADRAYPTAHRGLLDRVAAAGAVVSEVPVGARPTARASWRATGSSPCWPGPPWSSRPTGGRGPSPRPRRLVSTTSRSARCPGR